jgi:hypothetical protein
MECEASIFPFKYLKMSLSDKKINQRALQDAYKGHTK